MSQLSLYQPTQDNGAILSQDRKYRYDLWRKWDSNLPSVLFICLNPSKADETDDDATLRRCRGFAKSWGYGGFHIANLFAFRATDPKDMAAADDPIGPEWEKNMKETIHKCKDVVLAWGAHPMVVDRAIEMVNWLEREFIPARYIDKTKDGHPAHPLFLKKSLTLKYYLKL